MNKINLGVQLLRYFGAPWLLYRLSYAARMKAGLLERQMPAYRWDERPLASWLKPNVPAEAYVEWRKKQGGKFFFDQLPNIDQPPIDEAEAILAGHWRYFEGQPLNVGFPPDWHLNPSNNVRLPTDQHWSLIGDFQAGDIKLVWEASRFGVVFPLVRAYAGTRDERYAAAFWQLIEDWGAHNPPQTGANWKCGQETTFRLMAWCFGLYGFADSPHSTPERVVSMAAMIAAQAERIAGNIAYAQSQKNNHGISEGVGLWTVGLLFPELAQAEKWREHGQRVIVNETRRQIYADGSYVQHSTNYHRVMLHDLLWALRLGEINARRLPDEVYTRFEQATQFLYQLVDGTTGSVPNYGANDGALILPLNNCAYTDFRPVVQAACVLAQNKRVYPAGAWDEDLLWLFGRADFETGHRSQVDLAAGGYYTLRGAHSWAMIRCAHYQDRPSHADQLHFDLWWRGINIACDAGTYLYNGQPPWDNRLAATAMHNTATVDGHDQMTRAGRFLWLDWAQGRVTRQAANYWEGEHNGYAPVRHQRGILKLDDDTWMVIDRLSDQTDHEYRLHWLLPDLPYHADESKVRLQTNAGDYNVQVGCSVQSAFSLVRADTASTRGWCSLYYGEKEPALSCSLVVNATQNCTFWTIFSSRSAHVRVFQPPDFLGEAGELHATLKLLVDNVHFEGDVT